MEQPESSLPYSQVPATCPYPVPAQSCPCPHIPLPEGTSKHKFYSSCTNIQMSSLSYWTCQKDEQGDLGTLTNQCCVSPCNKQTLPLVAPMMSACHLLFSVISNFFLSVSLLMWQVEGAESGPKGMELTNSLFQLNEEAEPSISTD